MRDSPPHVLTISWSRGCHLWPIFHQCITILCSEINHFVEMWFVEHFLTDRYFSWKTRKYIWNDSGFQGNTRSTQCVFFKFLVFMIYNITLLLKPYLKVCICCKLISSLKPKFYLDKIIPSERSKHFNKCKKSISP